MKRATAAAIFVFSIVVFPTAVKTRAADLPNVSPSSRKTDPKDSVKDKAKEELAQLIDFMLKNGQDGTIGEASATLIGLAGPLPAKGQNIRNRINGKERDALNCFLIYEDVPGTTTTEGKKLTCVYLMRVTESPRVSDTQHFRVSLDGRLEKVATNRAKKGGDGKVIPGSGVALDDDLDSSAVQKTYAAEMRELKAWLKVQLKAQKKLDAKKATAGAAKPGQTDTASAAAVLATP